MSSSMDYAANEGGMFIAENDNPEGWRLGEELDAIGRADNLLEYVNSHHPYTGTEDKIAEKVTLKNHVFNAISLGGLAFSSAFCSVLSVQAIHEAINNTHL
jgi:hypothetical protein